MRSSALVQTRRTRLQQGRGSADSTQPAVANDDPRLVPAQMAAAVFGGFMRTFVGLVGDRGQGQTDFAVEGGILIARDAALRPQCELVCRGARLNYTPDLPQPGYFTAWREATDAGEIEHVTVGEPPHPDDSFFFPWVVLDYNA